MEQPVPGKRSPSVKTIEELVKQGHTLAAIGDQFGVSRQRIHQILNAIGQSVGAIRPSKGHGVNCPHCGNDRTHAHGHTEAGNDRFFCASCKRTFTIVKPKPRKKPLSNAERQRRFQAKKRSRGVDNPTEID